MPENYLPHIFLPDSAETVLYASPPRIGGKFYIPDRNRQKHSSKILQGLKGAWQQAKQKATDRNAVSLPTKDGTYLEFRSQAGYDLLTKSLEHRTQKIRLLNIRKEGAGENETTIATVYVPNGKENYFLKKIREYAQENKNANLVKSIEDVRLAVLVSFWQDDLGLIPQQSQQWCEVWLRVLPGQEEIIETQFRTLCARLNIQCREGEIRFPERTVLLVRARDTELAELIESSPYIAEFRLAKETAGFWVELPNEEQSQWVQDLLTRIVINENNVTVCVLDTGVNNGHPLLAPLLTDDNCQTVDPD